MSPKLRRVRSPSVGPRGRRPAIRARGRSSTAECWLGMSAMRVQLPPTPRRGSRRSSFGAAATITVVHRPPVVGGRGRTSGSGYVWGRWLTVHEHQAGSIPVGAAGRHGRPSRLSGSSSSRKDAVLARQRWGFESPRVHQRRPSRSRAPRGSSTAATVTHSWPSSEACGCNPHHPGATPGECSTRPRGASASRPIPSSPASPIGRRPARGPRPRWPGRDCHGASSPGGEVALTKRTRRVRFSRPRPTARPVLPVDMLPWYGREEGSTPSTGSTSSTTAHGSGPGLRNQGTAVRPRPVVLHSPSRSPPAVARPTSSSGQEPGFSTRGGGFDSLRGHERRHPEATQLAPVRTPDRPSPRSS